MLAAATGKAGLDEAAARDVLISGRHGDDVRAAERRWHEAGVSAVPAVIINDKYLISGGQPAAAFERALRSIAGGRRRRRDCGIVSFALSCDGHARNPRRKVG